MYFNIKTKEKARINKKLPAYIMKCMPTSGLGNNSNTFHIASYNLSFSQNKSKLIQNIRMLAANSVSVFCLQEVVGREQDEDFILNVVVKLLGKEWKYVCHVGEGGERQNFGTCILWNSTGVELQKADKYYLPKIEKLRIHEYLFEKLVGGKGEIITRRGIMGIFHFNNLKILISSVHLEHVGGVKQRNKQLRFLLESAGKNKIDHMIFAGDFNSFDLLKRGQERKSLYALFGPQFKDASEKIDWTADLHRIETPKKFPYFVKLIKLFHIHIRRKLDYIWVRNFEIISCKKYEIDGSDHLPIAAELLSK